jgi:hypothetical protein
MSDDANAKKCLDLYGSKMFYFFPFLPPPANLPRPNPLLPFSLPTTCAVLAMTCPDSPLPGLEVIPVVSTPGPPLSTALLAPIASFSGTGGGEELVKARWSSRSVAMAETRLDERRARSWVVRNFSKRSVHRIEVPSSRDLRRLGRSEKVDVAEGVVELSNQLPIILGPI